MPLLYNRLVFVIAVSRIVARFFQRGKKRAEKTRLGANEPCNHRCRQEACRFSRPLSPGTPLVTLFIFFVHSIMAVVYSLFPRLCF